MLKTLSKLKGALLLALIPLASHAIEPISYGLGGIAYWEAPRFGNALLNDERNWRDQSTGAEIERFHDNGSTNTQISALGYPTYLNSGQVLITHPGQNALIENRELFSGQLVLEWTGSADVRVQGATFVSSKSTVGSTGIATNGKRVYRITSATPNGAQVQVHGIGSTPITDLNLWMPNPANPQNASLEGVLFHPLMMNLINDRQWASLRFMDWGHTNGSPQQNWADRRRPDDCFATGMISRRNPAEGLVWYTDSNGNPVYISADRDTGVSYEHMIALCNQSNRDMWLCVPALATNDYLTKLANLLAYGSDGNTPYTSYHSNPKYAPLNSNRKVYLEYSNEIWSNGGSFPQGTWAQAQADAQGLTKGQFNARQFSNVWSKIEAKLGANRVIRIAAAWTANSNYTNSFMGEFYNNGSLLKPEVIAPTTYYGQGIQFWVHDTFTNLPGDPNHSYWTSSQFNSDVEATFDKWNFMVLSETQYDNGGNTGPDSIGAFPQYIADIATLRNLDIMAYEGGPSLYTNSLDHGGTADDGITKFILHMNRQDRFGEIYDIVLNKAFQKGLRAHSLFVDVSFWGKFGQWGHLEYTSQDPSTSTKWETIRRTYDEQVSFNHILDADIGSRPSFSTNSELPNAETGTAYSKSIAVSGGNGTRTVDLIGSRLVAGLSFNVNNLTIHGTATEAGSNFIYLRVFDGDGDVNWKTFSFKAQKRSTDPEVTLTFESQALSTSGVGDAEPKNISSYSFTSSSTTSLNINGISGGPWPNGWSSKVLSMRHWGQSIIMKRTDGRAFDLAGFDAGAFSAGSVELIATYEDGSVDDLLFDIPSGQINPLTHISIDLIGIKTAAFKFWKESDGAGGNSNGAIDNININSGESGPVDPPSGGTVTLDFNNLSAGEVGTSLTTGEYIIEGFNGPGGVDQVEVMTSGFASPAIRANNWSGKLTLRRTDGAAFTLESFQHGSMAAWSTNQDVIVTGHYAAPLADTVTAPLTHSGMNPLGTHTLNWSGLSSVTFDWAGGANNAYGALDSIKVSGSSGPVTPPSSEVTLDFNNLSAGEVGTSLSVGDYIVEGFSGPGGADQVEVATSGFANAVIRPNNWSGKLKLRRADGAAFTLKEFQHGKAESWGGSQDVIVTGHYASSGDTTTGGLNHNGMNPLATHTLNWSGLTSVTFDWAGGANNEYGVLDNIKVQ